MVVKLLPYHFLINSNDSLYFIVEGAVNRITRQYSSKLPKHLELSIISCNIALNGSHLVNSNKAYSSIIYLLFPSCSSILLFIFSLKVRTFYESILIYTNLIDLTNIDIFFSADIIKIKDIKMGGYYMSIQAKLKKKLSKIYLKLQFKKYGKIYKSDNCDLKYLFIPNKKSRELLVVFSGFSDYDQPARYNYVRSFQHTNINRLHILDDFGYDKRGAYYLGKERNLFIEEAVRRLIENISLKNNIPNKNIITSGTSKGGYAALYFSLKYGYGKAIAGAPQTLLGDYLIESKTFKTLQFIGGKDQEKSRLYLNKLLFDIVRNNVSSVKPNIFIHVGKGDHHYQNHVIPFIEHLNKFNIECELDIGNYEKHGEVGKYFPSFALKQLNTY